MGGSFSDIRDVIQVRLERGEEVEILDTKVLDAGQGGEKWAKVAPVSGEFRWVLGKFLDRTPPEAKVATSRNENPSWTLAKRSAEEDQDATPPEGRSTDNAKVGFRPVGVMRRYERGPDGEWHDGLLMELLAEDLIA